ncbi:hypothetical protein FACS1894110_05450 [Spirochaetia bacterium]|nr:hypothetical protein FACS1894110_05450 [Spirochaetia bacterium]
MIRKPVFPRLIGLLGLYGGVFILLVMIQFTKQAGEPRPDGRSLRRAAGSYREFPEKRDFVPADFVIPAARSAQTYNEALIRWGDQNFSLWNRDISNQNDEDMVIAYQGEAVRRGNYRAAVSAVSQAFLNGTRRTYESSVYLGGAEIAARSLAAADQEKTGRLSRQIIEKSPDFLRESHAFEFFVIRGDTNFINNGMALISSIDPADLTPELTPGVFEGLMDLRLYRPNGDNPFEGLVDQACFVISQSIRRMPGTKGTDLILVFQGDTADIEFNMRLGKALLVWAESLGSGDWIHLGRSLILSCLSLEDGSGTVPAALTINRAGEPGEDGAPRVSSARLYRILRIGEYYPRAAAIGSALNGLCAWTAAPTVSAAQENSVLDIAVTFPAGEAHYLLIRGVRPFSRIELHGTDWRTDSQFERYDSSGWVYRAQDQILVIKLRHRATVEHVRIFYGAAAAPVTPPAENAPQQQVSEETGGE